jgi:hypothetical protein
MKQVRRAAFLAILLALVASQHISFRANEGDHCNAGSCPAGCGAWTDFCMPTTVPFSGCNFLECHLYCQGCDYLYDTCIEETCGPLRFPICVCANPG